MPAAPTTDRALPKVTWRQALAWRLNRHGLDPVGRVPVEDVVRRLCGIQAQVASSAELAVRLRRSTSRPGDVDAALADGRLIRTWAMRGTLHLLTPEPGVAFLSLIAAGRSWERPVWVRSFGMTPEVIERLRVAVGEALNGRTLTREELIAEIAGEPGFEKLAEGLRSSWGTVLKPLAWQGDLCFGPNRGTRTTFMRPVDATDRWPGLPPPEEAAPIAIAAYLAAYGPATVEGFGTWLAGGWFGKTRLRRAFEAMGDRVAEVVVDGERAFVRTEDVDSLLAAVPTDAVRLLGGFDQWVLGPGTQDLHVIPPGRRSSVSRQSGWIAPIVLVGGVVAGTWATDGGRLAIDWFRESGKPPMAALKREAARLGEILGRDLAVAVEIG